MTKAVMIFFIIRTAFLGIAIGVRLSKDDLQDTDHHTGKKSGDCPKQLAFAKRIALIYSIGWIIGEIVSIVLFF